VCGNVTGVDLDRDLIAYYDAEAHRGSRVQRGALRAALRESFAELLAQEGRRALLDVGAGPGVDTVEWQADGFAPVGIDLAHANVGLMHARGLTAVTGSIYRLPFADRTFDAVWTMSTFVHVPHARFDVAMAELLRVVHPGAPLAIGTWGGIDFEGYPEFGELRPYRFFSLAAHDEWRLMLGRHAAVERFETFAPDAEQGWEYQYAVVRA
jgi:SAM-dependent methyltransferase